MGPPPRTVLLVDVGHGPIRGADQVTLTLIDGIDPARYRFILLTCHRALADACRARGIPVEFCPVRMLFAPRPRPRDLLDLAYFARLTARLIRTHDIALIHSINGNSCIWPFPAALWCRVPLLAHIHNYWSRRMRLLHRRAAGRPHRRRLPPASCGGFRNDPVGGARRLSIIYSGFSPAGAGRRARGVRPGETAWRSP